MIDWIFLGILSSGFFTFGNPIIGIILSILLIWDFFKNGGKKLKFRSHNSLRVNKSLSTSHFTQRKKWTKESRQPEVGDLVLVVDVNNPRVVGKIIEILTSKADGIVQVKVHISTAKHHLIRPITKLCLLATHDELMNQE